MSDLMLTYITLHTEHVPVAVTHGGCNLTLINLQYYHFHNQSSVQKPFAMAVNNTVGKAHDH